jgi:hypothetical protein
MHSVQYSIMPVVLPGNMQGAVDLAISDFYRNSVTRVGGTVHRADSGVGLQRLVHGLLVGC